MGRDTKITSISYKMQMKIKLQLFLTINVSYYQHAKFIFLDDELTNIGPFRMNRQ